MSNEALTTYLSDHVAGSVAAAPVAATGADGALDLPGQAASDGDRAHDPED